MSRLVIAAVLLVATATSAAETSSAAAAAVDNYTECEGLSLSCSDCVKGDTKQFDECSEEKWKWACSNSTLQWVSYSGRKCNGVKETLNLTTDGDCISADGDRTDNDLFLYLKVTEDTYTRYHDENCTEKRGNTVKYTMTNGECREDKSGSSTVAYSASGDKTKRKLTVCLGYTKGDDGKLRCNPVEFVGTFDTENDKEKCHVLRKYITDSTCGVVQSTTKETPKGAAAASVWALAAALAVVTYVSF